MSIHQLCAAFFVPTHTERALSVLFRIEDIAKTATEKEVIANDDLLHSANNSLLQVLSTINGYKEMETGSSKRRKYTLSFTIINSRVHSLLFRTKQRFWSNIFQNWALTDDK